MRNLLLCLALITATGCASIVSDSTYPVTFDSNPSGAQLEIRDDDGVTLFRGVGPTTLTLSASEGYFQGARYQIEATLPGYHPGMASLSTDMDPWYIGNIIFGGLIGFLIVDPATGAMWCLDDRMVVNLGTAETTAP